MIAYISRKTSWLRCFISFIPAAIMAILLCYLLDGPILGPLYDFLLKIRPSPVVSHELLIIESTTGDLAEDIIEPELLSTVLHTMTELGAQALIIQVPILGLSAGSNTREEEILYRFDEEFSILSSNIRNLFDGIRTGSVSPSDSERYVGELVELSERGKERLVSALVLRDEEGIISMENAAALFGQARRPGDLMVQLIRTGEGGRPGVLAANEEYSRVQPDRDGVLRRIAPVLTVPDLSGDIAGEKYLEHIVYSALKSKYEIWEIKRDRNDAILFEIPGKERDFRRISISDFLIYNNANSILRRLLTEGEALGIFRNIYGENRPGILYDFALSIRDEPASEENRQLWIEARNLYFESLEEFLYGPAEMHLLRFYEERNNTESRDSIIRIFADLRSSYQEVMELRKNLEAAISSSFCILGNGRDVEASALLANSIITGQAIEPGDFELILLGSLIAAFLSCFFVKSRGPFATLLSGTLLSLLFAAGFSLYFILSGQWLDPQISAAAAATGVFISFTWVLAARSRYTRHFRTAYGPFVSRSNLRKLIRSGKPTPSQLVKTRAILIAIKQSKTNASEDPKAPVTQSLLEFQVKASDIFKKAGGTITGAEGELIIACFGSPLEPKLFEEDDTTLALRATDLIRDIARRPECALWHFGLDIGNCVFAWTAFSGYFASGTTVQKAKILSRLVSRYNARVLISEAVNESMPVMSVTPIDSFQGKGESGKEPFYKLEV